MDDLDLATRLDRSIGSAPDGGAPLPTLIAEGRRVVRRRRLRGAAASLAAVVVVAGGASAYVGRSAPAPEPTATPPAGPKHAEPYAAVVYSPTGELKIPRRYDVLMRIDNPYDLRPPAKSVAVVLVDRDGQRVWAAAYFDGPKRGGTTGPAGGDESTFQTWVDEFRPGGMSTSPARTRLVRFTDSGISPLLGVTVLDQDDDIDLGAPFDTSDTRTSAAEVRSPGGDVYYVLGRQGPGLEPWVYVVTKAEGGADLDAFLDYARDRWGGDRAE